MGSPAALYRLSCHVSGCARAVGEAMEAPRGQVRSGIPLDVCESGYLEEANDLIDAGKH